MSVNKTSFAFIPINDMTSVYERADIQDLSKTAYEHFMNHKDEVLYLLFKGKIEGVLSIGDLERFYDGEKEHLEINRAFTYTSTIDYSAAEEFFRHIKTINEMPVVTENKELVGVIRKEKGNNQRNGQRLSLRYAKTGRNQWERKEIERFINETKAQVFIYTYTNKEVMELLPEEERLNIEMRANNVDSSMWKGLSDIEWQQFWQEGYEKDIVDIMRAEREENIPTMKNGIMFFPDKNGKVYSFKDGYRVTPNILPDSNRRIFIFGPCIALGAYVKDDQTIEAYLAECLIKDNYKEWEVLNRGMYGPEHCYSHLFVQDLLEDDIVIILMSTNKWLPDRSRDKLVYCGNLSEEFVKIPMVSKYFVDSASHCNYIVNQKLAERIYKDIRSTRLLDRAVREEKSKRIQDYYINWDIREYFMEYFEEYGLHKEPDGIRTGAIVMNCNPFTKGHRYLIEQALNYVDKLIIFVVEEDQSYFKFKDRLHMVEQGVWDLAGICVVPSGRYIISMNTFAQYFEKEQVQTVNSMDYDVYIFGEIVAAGLGIQYRFVGDEPLDQVTRKYNETLKRVLPDFGVSVVEIPRITVDKCGQMAVSATSVRKALRDRDMDKIERLCPKSTVTYMKEQLGLGGW